MLAAVVLMRRFRFELLPVPASGGTVAGTAGDSEIVATRRPVRTLATRPPGWWSVARTEGGWILAWTLRERGFVTLAALGALNATANAWGASDATSSAASVLAIVQSHARVLLILIATIYAGELVWRDRDVRAQDMLDALPVPTSALVAGRIVGILLAELVIVAPLAACALLVQGLRGGAGSVEVGLTLRWIFGLTYPFLAQLTLLSLLVHVVVQNKVAGHVALIVGWVLAVAMERAASLPAWVRYAEPPSFVYDATYGFGRFGELLVWSEVWYTALACVFALGSIVLWVRGVPEGWPSRWETARRRLSPTMIGTFGIASAVAVVAAANMAGGR
jgi:hypothetical protein